MDILEKNFMRYVCGYLIKKSLSVHKCETCEQYAKSITELDDSTFYCYLRSYDNSTDTFGNLKMPHDNFVHLISYLDCTFRENFEKISTETSVIRNFANLFNLISYKHPCVNFPLKYFIMFYSRVRLYYLLKYINRSFKRCRPKKE